MHLTNKRLDSDLCCYYGVKDKIDLELVIYNIVLEVKDSAKQEWAPLSLLMIHSAIA